MIDISYFDTIPTTLFRFKCEKSIISCSTVKVVTTANSGNDIDRGIALNDLVL